MSIPNFPFSAQGHRLRNNVFDAPACGQTYPNVVSNRFATAPTVNAKDPSGPSGTRKQTRISSGSGSAKHKSAVIGALAYLKQNVQPQQPQQTTMQLQQTSAHTQLRSWKRVEPEWRPNTSRRTHRATPPEWGPNISLLDMLQDPETGETTRLGRYFEERLPALSTAEQQSLVPIKAHPRLQMQEQQMSQWVRGDLNIWRPRVDTHVWDVKKGDAGVALVQHPLPVRPWSAAAADTAAIVDPPLRTTLYDPRFFV